MLGPCVHEYMHAFYRYQYQCHAVISGRQSLHSLNKSKITGYFRTSSSERVLVCIHSLPDTTTIGAPLAIQGVLLHVVLLDLAASYTWSPEDSLRQVVATGGQEPQDQSQRANKRNEQKTEKCLRKTASTTLPSPLRPGTASGATAGRSRVVA